jgi:hypothetical protein
MPLMTTRKKLWLRMVENKTLIVWILQEYIIAFVGRFLELQSKWSLWWGLEEVWVREK